MLLSSRLGRWRWTRRRDELATTGSADPRHAMVLGIEHEFRVLDDDGIPVDFRTLIDAGGFAGARVDPRDRYALRRADGNMITADGLEAEIAIPPTPLRRGAASSAAQQSARAAAGLRAELPGALALRGYSTHLSVSLDDSLTAHVAHLFAQSFAPALMLLLDQSDAPGLLCRPRPRRVEFGGDYAGGDDLRAALLMVVGGVLACAAYVTASRPRLRRGRRDRGLLFPPLIRVAADWAFERFGWYVDRGAFGGDLYTDGRQSRLQLRSRGWTDGQRQLESCWQAASTALGALASDEERRLVEERVAGLVTLPCERDVDESPAFDWGPADDSPHGLIAERWERPGFRAAAVAATWDFCVLRIEGERELYLNVPRAAFSSVREQLDRGDLDERVAAEMCGDGRVLARTEQTGELGFYDTVAEWRTLLPREPLNIESYSGMRTAATS